METGIGNFMKRKLIVTSVSSIVTTALLTFFGILEGTTIEKFPKKIGKWEGTIDGYQVKRETSVQEKEEEVYMVTFTENWS